MDYCINCNFVIPFGKCFGKESCRVTSVSPLLVFIRVCGTMNLAPVFAVLQPELSSAAGLDIPSPGQMTLVLWNNMGRVSALSSQGRECLPDYG